MKKSLLRENRGLMLVLLCIFALMLALNSMTPLFADDYIYALNLHSEKVLTGFSDVLNSISGFRAMHNGRLAAHFFAQLFLWLPQGIFAFVNAAVFTLLMYIVYCFIKSDDAGRDTLMTACAFAMIWVLAPGFGHSFLWRTGACSYLWAACIVTSFIYPFYRRFVSGGGQKCNVFTNVLALAFAFFAGAYSESGSFSALAIAFCFLVLICFKERKLPKVLALRFAAACAGFLFLMLSPSELGKKNVESSNQIMGLLGKIGINGKILVIILVVLVLLAIAAIWGLKYHRKKFCKAAALAVLAAIALVLVLSLREMAGIAGFTAKLNWLLSEIKLGLVLLFGIYLVLLLVYMAFDRPDRDSLAAAVVFGIGAAASVLIFILAVYFPARAACVTTVYLTIADILLLCEISKTKGGEVIRLHTAIVFILFVPALILGVKDIVALDAQFEERKIVVAQAREEGRDELLLEPLLVEGKYAVAWQGEAADYYYAMEEFFGIDSITIEGAKHW